MTNLEMVRSDHGDGGWSLHAPDGELLLSGEAQWVDEGWNRPNADDRALAERINAAADQLFADAVEIARDDRDFARSRSWNDFSLVMWPDDHDMEARGLDRDTYDTALRRAFGLYLQRETV